MCCLRRPGALESIHLIKISGDAVKIPFRQHWDLLSQYIRPQRTRFILLTVLLFSSIGMQLVNPQIMRFFIDTTQTSKDAPASCYRGAGVYRHCADPTGGRGQRHLCGRECGLDCHQCAARRDGAPLPESGHELPQQRQPRRTDRTHRRRCGRAVQLLLADWSSACWATCC